MTCCILEKFRGFTDVGLLRLLKSIRAYTHLILNLQASVRSRIIGNMASVLTSQKAFLNDSENFVNRRVDIREKSNIIKTLSVTH